LARIRELATTTDFSKFKSVELHEALEVHQASSRHLARFGGHLRRGETSNPSIE